PLPDEERQPFQRVVPDLAEAAGRMAVAEVPRPTPQENVEILDHRFDTEPQPRPDRESTDPVAATLHRLVRGPASQESDTALAPHAPRPYPLVTEAQEIEPRAVFGKVHDAGLGLLRLQAEFSQQAPQPRQRGLGLLTGLTQHQHVVGEPDQHPMRS